MSCPNVQTLGARLRRSRALSVALGRRSFFVHPCDLQRGRPTVEQKAFLDKWSRGYKTTGEYDDDWDDCQIEAGNELSVILPDIVDYLVKIGSCSGWFEITERAQLLGSPVSVRVRDYDVLVTAGSIFGPPNSCFLATDGVGQPCRRAFVPMSGPAPRQRMHARLIQDASNIRGA